MFQLCAEADREEDQEQQVQEVLPIGQRAGRPPATRDADDRPASGQDGRARLERGRAQLVDGCAAIAASRPAAEQPLRPEQQHQQEQHEPDDLAVGGAEDEDA